MREQQMCALQHALEVVDGKLRKVSHAAHEADGNHVVLREKVHELKDGLDHVQEITKSNFSEHQCEREEHRSAVQASLDTFESKLQEEIKQLFAQQQAEYTSLSTLLDEVKLGAKSQQCCIRKGLWKERVDRQKGPRLPGGPARSAAQRGFGATHQRAAGLPIRCAWDSLRRRPSTCSLGIRVCRTQWPSRRGWMHPSQLAMESSSRRELFESRCVPHCKPV